MMIASRGIVFLRARPLLTTIALNKYLTIA